MKLKNKIAIITGSTRGIGYAVAEAFIKEGATVILCGSTQNSADIAANKILESFPNSQVYPFGVNLTNTNEIKSLVQTVIDKYGKIDILVNNAGITGTCPLIDLTDDEWDKMISINVTGMFKITREVVKHMKDTGGSIINTSSMVGTNGSKMQVHYAASKGAINSITKSLAKELGKYNIRVNAVAPGVVLTDMTKDAVNDQMLGALKSMTPLGKAANPNELAGAYVYFASDDSSFTTGTILGVDGGLLM